MDDHDYRVEWEQLETTIDPAWPGAPPFRTFKQGPAHYYRGDVEITAAEFMAAMEERSR